jgi:hypothetical protein
MRGRRSEQGLSQLLVTDSITCGRTADHDPLVSFSLLYSNTTSLTASLHITMAPVNLEIFGRWQLSRVSNSSSSPPLANAQSTGVAETSTDDLPPPYATSAANDDSKDTVSTSESTITEVTRPRFLNFFPRRNHLNKAPVSIQKLALKQDP